MSKDTVRRCVNCDNTIEHKHINAKFCRLKCKDRYHNRNNPRGFGRGFGVKIEFSEHDDPHATDDAGWESDREGSDDKEY